MRSWPIVAPMPDLSEDHEGIEVLGGDLEPARTPLAERLADVEEVVARRSELVVVPAPVGLGRRFDNTKPFELFEPAPRAMGQYWPYVLMTPVFYHRLRL
jgi:hypothetical protein